MTVSVPVCYCIITTTFSLLVIYRGFSFDLVIFSSFSSTKTIIKRCMGTRLRFFLELDGYYYIYYFTKSVFHFKCFSLWYFIYESFCMYQKYTYPHLPILCTPAYIDIYVYIMCRIDFIPRACNSIFSNGYGTV